MGGDQHHEGHHHEPFKVPDYRIYRWQDHPELVAHQRKLNQMGLHDPWLRNYVHGYNPTKPTHGPKLRKYLASWFLGKSFLYGLTAAVVLIGIEKLFINPRIKDHLEHSDHTWERPAHHH